MHVYINKTFFSLYMYIIFGIKFEHVHCSIEGEVHTRSIKSTLLKEHDYRPLAINFLL